MPTEGPCFIISNHPGLYDPVFLNYFIRRDPLSGIMTDEFLRAGLAAYLFRKLGTVATRKFQPQNAPVRDVLRLLQDNRMIVVMPEGESNWDGITLPTVASTGKLFRMAGVPVHPVTIHNGYQAFPRWASWPRPAKVYIEFHPPLNFSREMSDADAARMVDEAVQWRPDWEPEALRWDGQRAFRPGDGIMRLIFRCPNCGLADGLRESRGRTLHCSHCSNRWQVTAGSELINRDTGDQRSSTDLFHSICRMAREPVDFGRAGTGLIRTTDLTVLQETAYPDYRSLGRFDCILRAERIDLLPKAGGEAITIPLGELASFSAELKVKLQLRTVDTMYQIIFGRKSALHWQVYLKGLLPALESGLVRPTDYANGHGLKTGKAA
jgi:hypothetical protein